MGIAAYTVVQQTEIAIQGSWEASPEALLCSSNSELLEEAPGQWAAGSNLKQIESSPLPSTQKNLTKAPLAFHPLVYYCPIKAHPFFPLKLFLLMSPCAHTFFDHFLQP